MVYGGNEARKEGRKDKTYPEATKGVEVGKHG